MRIAVVVPNRFPNPIYRAVAPMEELSRRGHVVGTAVLSEMPGLPQFDTLLDCDLVYFWQMHHAPVRRIAKALRDAGVAVTWDSDDDITTVPRGSPSYRQYGGVRGQRTWAEMQSMIRLADAVTTTSPELAQKFAGAGQEHVHVIENQLPDVGPQRSPGRGGNVTVGWVAGLEHVVDVKALDLRAAFTRLLETRSDVEVTTVGLALDIDHPRYRRAAIVDFPDLTLEIERFDIGVAPLADVPFNRSRSNVKVKEYAARGVPWLASRMGPYSGLGEDQGGRLVDDDRWYEELVALVDDGRARKRLAARAHKWAKTQTIRANVGEWERILEAAVSRARVRRASGDGEVRAHTRGLFSGR